MRKLLLLLVVAFFTLTTSCCGSSSTSIESPTVIQTEESASENPSANVSLYDTWTRPADGMVMVYVPAGEFEMGSNDQDVNYALELCNEDIGECEREWFGNEQPAHTVALESFWIDQTEVTNAQYRKCVEAEICEAAGCWDYSLYNASNQPVVCMSWYQAQAYSEWVGGRLPTEAEWEYAACGPEEWIYPWGNEFGGARLNHCDAKCESDGADRAFDDGYAYTAPVGSYPDGASWCGALDMAGNVEEWVSDWYGDYHSGHQVNPTGPSSGYWRVTRSSDWINNWRFARCACRGSVEPVVNRDLSVGFRVVFPDPVPTDP